MRKAILVAIPIFGLALMLQTAIVSRVMLLSGNADLFLLILAAWGLQERVPGAWIWGVAGGILVGMVSGVPWYIYLISYLLVIGVARLLIRRIWQAPLLAMFSVTLTGTLVLLLLTFVQRSVFEVSLAFSEIFIQIILPSVLLNLLLAIPVYSLIRDLANRLYPADVIA